MPRETDGEEGGEGGRLEGVRQESTPERQGGREGRQRGRDRRERVRKVGR